MTLYYSLTSKGFYDTNAFTYALPSDAIEISAEQYGQLYSGQAAGQVIQSNGAGGLQAVTVAPPAPTLAQQAAALIAGGIAITSTGTPSLNGVYSTNAQAQQNLLAVQVYIQANGSFPGSSGTYAWFDASGTPRVFPTKAEFTALATAIANFVADCTMIILTGAGILPAATATIP